MLCRQPERLLSLAGLRKIPTVDQVHLIAGRTSASTSLDQASVYHKLSKKEEKLASAVKLARLYQRGSLARNLFLI